MSKLTEEEKIEILISTKVPEEPVGWLETELPKPVMSRLQSYIETAKKDPTSLNNDLAGNISKSLTLKDKDDWFFKTILIALIDKFLEKFPSYRRQVHMQWPQTFTLCLEPLWVNFQKENEFNPLHDHSGVYSFVIWMQIPTSYEEQKKLPICAESNSHGSISNFGFHYTNSLGRVSQFFYNMEKEAEGYMVMFPSEMKHEVFPFYENDGERISISGNIDIV